MGQSYRWNKQEGYEGGRGPHSFKPNGAVEESLEIHLLSAVLLWIRVQPALVSRPEREKFEMSCWAK